MTSSRIGAELGLRRDARAWRRFGAAAATSVVSAILATVRLFAALAMCCSIRPRMRASRAAAGRAAEHDGDHVAVAAPHRRHEIEAGRAGVAGLDPVDAFDAAEQLVVIAHRVAAIGEARRREIAVVARKAILDGAAERGLIARGGELVLVGQARGVVVDRARHAERARLARHHAGEGLFIAADRFRDHHGGVVGGLGDERADRILDREGLARQQAELRGRLLRGVIGDLAAANRAGVFRLRSARTADRAS